MDFIVKDSHPVGSEFHIVKSGGHVQSDVYFHVSSLSSLI